LNGEEKKEEEEEEERTHHVKLILTISPNIRLPLQR